MSDGLLDFFLVVAPGLSHQLGEEARSLGFKVTSIEASGVSVRGTWQDVWRANLELRGATRVLVRVASFRALHLAQLDKRSRKFPWADWVRVAERVRVETSCRKSRIYHAKAATQRVENALRAAGFTVDAAAEVVVKLRIEDDLATFSIDSSGDALHKRQLKAEMHKAPLRESLAALFLRSAGYDGSTTVYDPMCGSGTLVLEAAEIACGLQPGRARTFAFQKLASFDDKAFEAMRRPVDANSKSRFYGSDQNAGAVRMSSANAERAGLSRLVSFHEASLIEATPPKGLPGLVITNPPYGGRIGNAGALRGLYGAFGKVMRERFSGWRIALITSETGLAKSTGLPWERPGAVVDNGGTKIRLWQVQL